MGPFHVVSLLILLVQAEGRAFDPCNCEDLDGPDIQNADGFLNDKSTDSPTPLNSGTQSRLNQKAENSIGNADSNNEISTDDGNYYDGRSNASVRRREREVAKDSGASANKTVVPEVANLETSTAIASPIREVSGSKTNKPESTPATNAATDKPAGKDKIVPEKPNKRSDSSDNLARDGSTSTTDPSARKDNTDDGNLETPKTESSTTKSQCEEHYTWDKSFKKCFYDPQNVPVAKYDENGNIDANAGVTTESAPTTTVVHDCPEHQKWDERLGACYFEPNMEPPANMDYYGDVFANAE